MNVGPKNLAKDTIFLANFLISERVDGTSQSALPKRQFSLIQLQEKSVLH